MRACRGGGTVAWALDASLELPVAEQVRALAEGAVLGGYDAGRWRSGRPRPGVERFVICGDGERLGPAAERASLVARWTNAVRELVDAPPNVISLLQQSAGHGPWADVDVRGPALLDEDRSDAFGRGATGYGVRMPIELPTRCEGRLAAPWRGLVPGPVRAVTQDRPMRGP